MNCNQYFSVSLALVFWCLGIGSAQAQVKAVSEYGDTVMLLTNGRWQFIDNYRKSLEATALVTIPTSEVTFTKPSTSKTVEKGDPDKYEIWYDTEKWETIDAKALNPEADMAFLYQGTEEAYGMVIYEGFEVEIEKMRDIAIGHAENVGENITVQRQEYRQVNGSKLLLMELTGEISGIDLHYFYYFGNMPQGTIQYIVFCERIQAKKLEDELMGLLNGLVLKGE